MQSPEIIQIASPSKSAEQQSLIPLLNVHESEVDRQMHICNACRYCEGFCAVFPAMTRRLDFAKADIHYLAKIGRAHV